MGIDAASPLTLDANCLLDGYTVPALLMDRNYRVLAWNRAYRRSYGDVVPSGTQEQKHCYEVSHQYTRPCDQEGEPCPMQLCLQTGVPQRMLHIHTSPRGMEYVEVEMRPLPDADGRICYLLEVFNPTRIASVTPKPLGLVGQSPAFKRMLKLIDRVASSRVSVLLSGESGTGKEVVARTIHEASNRASQPFVPVECSGLTETLFESELFGHEKGAFTGAYAQKQGLIEAADQGTLFLDEIGDVSLQLQVKLLRLLETRTFRKVGGVNPLQSDFRLICATHRDLATMVENGEFRLDLYYRLSTFPIHIPSLRERWEDIPLLAQTLLQRLEECRGKTLSDAALLFLAGHRFAGNIRELLNMLARGCLLADDAEIGPEHLVDIPREYVGRGKLVQVAMPTEVMTLETWERVYLRHLAETFQGDKKALAAQLGISERTLYRKLGSIGVAAVTDT
ncbi:MAG: sigma-54-dependent Fis family transcriptional regulator [Magnetococcales bacterium]|nr:sigma-54-dependent Fis family transcriptional regulator [Magnetococcales bacterium]